MTELQSRPMEVTAENMEKYKKSAAYYFLKRTMDLIFLFFRIIVFDSIKIMIAIVIKLYSKEPIIFFKGKRVFCV